MQFVALLLLACAFLGGCQRPPGDANLCSVPTPHVATKVTVISYESHGMPYLGDLMTQCSQGTALSVRHQKLPYDELVNQATFSMSGKSPSPYDIIHVYDQLLVEWASKGWLAPLDDLVAKYWKQYELDQIPPSVWDMMKVDGRIYGIPAIQNPEIFFYRKDLFEKFGLKVPNTYDELAQTCKQLQQHTGVRYPLLMMYSKSSDHVSYEFHDLLHSLGGQWFKADGSPAFNSAIGEAALEKMVDLYRSCVHPDVVNFTPEDALIGLEQGQFLMAVFWANEAPQVNKPELSRFAGKFAFAPAPAGCAGCVPASYWAQDSWVIPANASVDREVLFRIAMEATQQKNQARLASVALVTRPAAAGVQDSPYWAAAMQTVERGAVGMDRKPYAYLAQEAVTRYALEALLGHLSAREALDRAAAEFLRGMRAEGFYPVTAAPAGGGNSKP